MEVIGGGKCWFHIQPIYLTVAYTGLESDYWFLIHLVIGQKLLKLSLKQLLKLIY